MIYEEKKSFRVTDVIKFHWFDRESWLGGEALVERICDWIFVDLGANFWGSKDSPESSYWLFWNFLIKLKFHTNWIFLIFLITEFALRLAKQFRNYWKITDLIN